MKTYEETVETVFDRISQHRATQKRKKKLAVRLSASACCVCLLGIACFGLVKSGYTAPEPAIEDALQPGIPDYTEPSQLQSKPVEENKIIVNQLEKLPGSDRMNICLMLDDFIPMTEEALTEYYGINIKPEIPEDIPEWEDQTHGIYRRNSGTGEVYWDTTILNYSNADFTRSVNLEIDKGQMPLLDYGVLGFGLGESNTEVSLINGTEVMIGLSDNGYYAAEFMYKDVGFWIIAEGLTETEFVAIVESLIV